MATIGFVVHYKLQSGRAPYPWSLVLNFVGISLWTLCGAFPVLSLQWWWTYLLSRTQLERSGGQKIEKYHEN